ncbi:gamma-glutamylcyclotransferase [Desulfovibrio aminophilus]|uniref:gamma-glutamylcyclotransferase family protein n=1 Tax=Desulfovibrio aminophilus TaxID=81425 RepID=UPI00339177FA
MNRKHAVFVYGTLKRGKPNHFFLRGARFLGRAETVEPYALFEDEYPIVSRTPAVGPVLGEVYSLDEKALRRLDVLEQHPEIYRREQVPVRLEGGVVREAWLYFHPEPMGRLIPSGDWSGLDTDPDDDPPVSG